MSTTYILEDLQPDSSYEVYVQARNFYGTGAPTTRIVFRTASKTVVDLTKTGKVFFLNTVNLSQGRLLFGGTPTTVERK